MTHTDISERGLESLIVNYLTGHNHYEEGTNSTYSRQFALDEEKLLRFLSATQSEELSRSGILDSQHNKLTFFSRLQSEISQRGIVDLLRNGINLYPSSFILFYLTPSQNNHKAKALHSQNIFSVTRQLRYSQDNKALSVDLCIFINGLPVATIELKNTLTGQTVEDAVNQYKNSRDPIEPLFSFKHCLVHFAADDMSVKFCTHLAGQNSNFLPFNKGLNDGAGNPLNPSGLMTDYLWKDILTREKLTLIIENYACLVGDKMIFPRYHQLDAVTRLVDDVRENGVGRRYLIQHSAGSGKSNSIAWLAHQLAGLEEGGRPMFDSVFVVTDRRILDRQIRSTVMNFTQLTNTVTHADDSRGLMDAITAGKRIIITTIEKFPYISHEIGNKHKGRRFAVIIDEAHSGQDGRNSAEMNRALFGGAEDYEDEINFLVESRKMLGNASYFAFTATPKNKTLEIFGTPYQDGGEVKHKPFHTYTMKQAVQEGFILDVLRNYTPVKSYYRIVKTIEADPKFDKKRAMRVLKDFAEGSKIAIAEKAAMMVEHFHEHVIARGEIGGRARAMIVTSSIHNCIEYYRAVNEFLAKRKSPYKAIIAFSGTNNDFGSEITSRELNGFSDSKITENFREEPYRILIAADMFQTGFDEPLLHTMYVDKPLSGIKAVQTLSRLNRCCPGKYDTFILDFANDTGTIEEAFSRYYQGVILSRETDPKKLAELEAAVMECGLFSVREVEEVVREYISGAGREMFEPLLNKYVLFYGNLGTELQIKFKRSARAFVRTYNFLAAILPFCDAKLERLCIFLTLLLPKLPSLSGDEIPVGLVEAVDLESYRVEAEKSMSLVLEEGDSELPSVGVEAARGEPKSEEYLLSVIVSEFNRICGNVVWNKSDDVKNPIFLIPDKVLTDTNLQNALNNSDRDCINIEAERISNDVLEMLIDYSLELYKKFEDDIRFKEWLSNIVLRTAYLGSKAS